MRPMPTTHPLVLGAAELSRLRRDRRDTRPPDVRTAGECYVLGCAAEPAFAIGLPVVGTAGLVGAAHTSGVVAMIGAFAEARLAVLPTDRPLVVPRQCGARSAIAASVLLARGRTNVASLVGGHAAWQQAGLPVTRDAEAVVPREAAPAGR